MGRASKRRFVGAVAACVVIMAFIRLTPTTEKARQALHRHDPLRPIDATAAERLKARRRSPRNLNHLSADMPGWGDAGVDDLNVSVEKPPPTTTRAAIVARRPRPPAMAAPVVDDDADNAVVELQLKDDRVQGTIRIRLTPELSGPRSSKYLQKLATVGGGLKRDHNIFRNEPTLLLQGRLSDGRVPEILDAPRGRCPISVPADYKASYCDCGCNGPIMQRGMVAWAGGYGHGPDFFIFTGGQAQAVMWKHDHTIWGMVADDESFQTIDRIYKLATHPEGVTMLDQPVNYELELVAGGAGQAVNSNHDL